MRRSDYKLNALHVNQAHGKKKKNYTFEQSLIATREGILDHFLYL